MTPHYGKWYNYFIIYHNVIIIETKCTINVMHLNHPQTSPLSGQWKNCLPWNWWKLLSHIQLFATPWAVAPPDSSVHGILQARILEWVAFPFSRESSRLRDWTQVTCVACRFFTIWATRIALWNLSLVPKRLGTAVWRKRNHLRDYQIPQDGTGSLRSFSVGHMTFAAGAEESSQVLCHLVLF